MKKLFLITALSLSLVNCASVQEVGTAVSAIVGTNVTQSQLDAAESTYDGTVLAPLHRYALLRVCRMGESFSVVNQCHDRIFLKAIREVDKTIDANIQATQAAITNGDANAAIAAYKLLTSAITEAQNQIALSGANKLI